MQYCSQCGNPLNQGDRFCGACGSAVIQTCPTCGRGWDGIYKGETFNPGAINSLASERIATKFNEPKVTEVRKKSATDSEVVTTSKPVIKVNQKKITSARIDPIYGDKFVSGVDCANCGAKNQANKVCRTCGNES